MSSALRFAVLLILASGQALYAAEPESLAGCWRMQHRQERFVDGRERESSIDCVFDFEVVGGHATLQRRKPSGYTPTT